MSYSIFYFTNLVHFPITIKPVFLFETYLSYLSDFSYNRWEECFMSFSNIDAACTNVATIWENSHGQKYKK